MMEVRTRIDCNDMIHTGLIAGTYYSVTEIIYKDDNPHQYRISTLAKEGLYHVSHFYPAEVIVPDTPKWVTAKEGYSPFVTKNKDYKTYPHPSPDMYLVMGDDGMQCLLGKECFYSKEECLAEHKLVEEEESFDNLTYISPAQNLSIQVDALSNEQQNFLNDELVWGDRDRFGFDDWTHLCYYSPDGIWELIKSDTSYDTYTFNDIFVEKTNAK